MPPHGLGRSHWLKIKNPDAPAMTREAEGIGALSDGNERLVR